MKLYSENEIDYKIDEILKKLQKLSKRREGETNENYLSRIEKKITQELDAEINLFLRGFYREVRENLFNIDFFKNNIENRNLFDNLNLRSRAFEECKFKFTHIQANQPNNNLKTIKTVSAVVGGGGMILAIIQGSVLPLTLVVASILAVKITKNKNTEEQQKNINIFFKELKLEFQNWVKEVEKFILLKIRETFPEFNF